MSKKDDIKKAFVDLIITKGIRNINMNEVFTKAETGSGTFYNYYKSKEDLIEELFFDYIRDAINSIKVEIPSGLEITDVKPLIMNVLDNIIHIMDSKNTNLQVLEILGPEFAKKEETRKIKDFEEFRKKHLEANGVWSWFNEIILKGQELGQIVKLNPTIIGKMIIGAFSRLFIPKSKKPKFDTKNDNEKFHELVKDKYASEHEINLIKECIWNMITVHNEK